MAISVIDLVFQLWLPVLCLIKNTELSSHKSGEDNLGFHLWYLIPASRSGDFLKKATSRELFRHKDNCDEIALMVMEQTHDWLWCHCDEKSPIALPCLVLTF